MSAATPDGPVSIPGYVVLGELGRGGAAVVYKARHMPLGRLVALKVLRDGAGPEQQARFRWEAEALARLRHPNVVQLFEIGEHAGRPYLALELVEGGSLAGTVRPARQAAHLAEVLARAAHHIHRQGLVHRDLKPANVLLTVDGAPKITDFGLARRLDDAPAARPAAVAAVAGTPAYMAPEQADGRAEAVGPAADVYALGAVLYEMLTGRPPFVGATPLETLDRARSQAPMSPRALSPGVPCDLETICLKCLEKEPARRYGSAEELADDLRRFLDGLPILARPVGRLGRAARWCRRRPSLAAGLAVAAVALAAAAVVGARFGLYRSEAKAVSEAKEGEAKGAEEQARKEAQQRDEADRARRRTAREAAELAWHKGRRLCEAGEHGLGGLWLARSLELLPEGEADLSRDARTDLAVWRSRFFPVVRRLQVRDPDNRDPDQLAAFGPDGRTVLTGGASGAFSGEAQLWEVATGMPVGKALRHPAAVTAVAVSPDGLALLTGSTNEARLWRAATGEPVGQPLEMKGEVRGAAFSPDGKAVLTAAGNEAHLWDAATGKARGGPWRHRGEVRVAAWAPDGQTVLLAGPVETRLYDAATGEARGGALRTAGEVFAAAFSPDGRVVLTGGTNEARLWGAASGEAIGGPLPHEGEVRAVAFSPDGKTIATAAGADGGEARLWDAATGKLLGAVRHPTGLAENPILVPGGLIKAVAFRPDGLTLLTAGQDRTALWEAPPPGADALTLPHDSDVTAVAFSPDGKDLVTGCLDDTTRLWRADTGTAIGQPLRQGTPAKGVKGVYGVMFSQDGRTVFTGGWGAGRLWDAATGRPIGQPIPGPPFRDGVALSPDGAILLTGLDTTARLWSTATGRPLGPPLELSEPVGCVAFSPDGKTFLTGGAGSLRPAPNQIFPDGEARLWDTATRRPVGAPLRQKGVVGKAVFSPDGKTVLTDGLFEARLWDAATGRPLGPPRPQASPRLAYGPDGKTVLVAVSPDSARLWDAATGAFVGPPLPHRHGVTAAAFSPDGRLVATGTSRPFDLAKIGDGQPWGEVCVWEAATGRRRGPPASFPGPVHAVAFSPDGRRVVAGSGNVDGRGEARAWSLPGPLGGDAARIALWAQVLTGTELDERGEARALDRPARAARVRRLREAGGPPRP
jgi:WD40 repeat protein